MDIINIYNAKDQLLCGTVNNSKVASSNSSVPN